ncbi:SGNH/GDSL hydrolase family protein [Lapidilactobacillus wuchangensis]|uniref:SGNH/GDSL hydrolase family protein n=1 Tax=Lapidilactobacillus wuchangensis TaxID=2486001 RepID=UPI0013DD8DD9|nr:SGNH/GDSL hydrolase family protein [Lapidilactobacillus wuchangensis]
MKNIFKGIKVIVIIAIVAVITVVGLNFLIKSPSATSTNGSKARAVKTTATKKTLKKVNYVAIGDSLTYGIGDATENGGYVPLVKTQLANDDNTDVSSLNFGVSGDTSTQVYQRIVKQPKIQRGLAQANLITMTIGANDLMHIINKNVLNMDLKKVETARTTYQANLERLLKKIRSYNKTAPIFVASIYNPFYVYFPQITDMKTAMDDWNATAQKVIKEFDQTYYVDIDQVMTQPKGSVLANNKDKKEALNPYLFTEDHFHPNNRGYQAISQQFIKQIQARKSTWLYQTSK